jgi:hypothetical protein
MPLSDAKLARLGKKYDALKEQIKALEAEKAKISTAVIKELDRRGTKAIECDGTRVSIVRQTTTQYNIDLAREVLPAAVFKKVVKTVLDPALVAQQQQAGKITVEDAAEFATVITKAPYISVGSASE